jgi:hypothetical protein
MIIGFRHSYFYQFLYWTPASWPKDPEFKYYPGNKLPWLRFACFISVNPRNCRESILSLSTNYSFDIVPNLLFTKLNKTSNISESVYPISNKRSRNITDLYGHFKKIKLQKASSINWLHLHELFHTWKTEFCTNVQFVPHRKHMTSPLQNPTG